METVRIFIGYDPREAAAYHVCCESLIRNSSLPLAITPLAENTLRGVYRDQHRDASNTFVYSRFLVPYLCDFRGAAIYLDGDMVVRDDIANLWELRRGYVGASVVQHPTYKTKHPVKYFGSKNLNYPRKNWSSVILWSCGFAPNRVLTPDYIDRQPGSHLHSFAWLGDEQIGTLPPRWNQLCMEQEQNPQASIYHYTIAIPGISGYAEQEGGEEWWTHFGRACAPVKV